MSMIVEDRSGLNPTDVRDMPLLTNEADAVALRAKAVSEGASISVAGMRHSQGGQTSRTGTFMAVNETYNRVAKPVQLENPHNGDTEVKHAITVDGGAVWSQVHHALNPKGLAPLVHQSSPHFTIGGSISVNCHGRDHRWGAVANTILSMNVLTGAGKVTPTSPTQEPDLFRAVIGGYGSCGQILNATIAVTTNYQMQQLTIDSGDFEINVRDYQKYLVKLHKKKIRPEAELHIGWLKFTDKEFFEKVAGYDYVFNGIRNTPASAVETVEEDYGESEMMRAGWHAAMQPENEKARQEVWEVLTRQNLSKAPYRINFLRQAISFTGYRGESDADILLEYFIPLNRFADFVEECRKHYLNRSNKEILRISSGSTRLLGMEDTLSNLSYSRFVGGQPMVSLALDLNIRLTPGTRTPRSGVSTWVNELTRKALTTGGTYYLPYYKFADKDLFNLAYNKTPAAQAGYAAQIAAIKKYNPNKVYWNDFLELYFKL